MPVFFARAVLIAALALPCMRAGAATLQVVPGTADGDLCRAIGGAREGDSIWVAEGTITLSAPCVVQKRRLSVVGGYKTDFSSRDAFAQPTRILAGPKVAGLIRVVSGGDDFTLEGVVLDGGSADAFQGSCSDCMSGSYNAATNPALVEIDSAGRVRLHSVIFVNAPGGAVNANASGTLQIENVAALNTRPFAFRLAGACGYASPQCFDAVVRQATIVWTWRESSSEGSPGGSAIVVGAGTNVRIESSVIAYSDKLGVELDGAGAQQATIMDVIVFDNHSGDVGQAHANGLNAAPIATAGVSQGLSGPAVGRMERLGLPWDADYLRRFLQRQSNSFYGARLPWERAFMLSPSPGIGLKSPQGSRFTYEMAVAGGPALAKLPEPAKVEPDAEDKKDPKGKKKKKMKVPKKKGGK